MQQRPIDNVPHDTYSVAAALADGMAYYQNQAIQKCWQDGASSCAAGAVDLTNRTGSQVNRAYRAGYETVTDGTNYIVTTLDTQCAVAALKGMSYGSSSVGYYDQTTGRIVLPDKENETVVVRFSNPMI